MPEIIQGVNIDSNRNSKEDLSDFTGRSHLITHKSKYILPVKKKSTFIDVDKTTFQIRLSDKYKKK
jgi:hypothetical protein